MKKVLFVASVTRHINTFHLPYLKYFKDKGYEVHVASNGDEKIKNCDKHFNLEFERSPLKSKNIKAYKNLKEIINKEEYEIIHCHTPVASVLTRIAAKKMRRRIGTKIIYTAHGFHFFKGAPLKNWILYYPIEKMLSKHTDILITINKEDYEFAKKKLKTKKIEHVHGIGVNKKKFEVEMTTATRDTERAKFTIEPLDFLITYVAELNDNKNQMMIIDAMKILVKKYTNIKVLLAGDGVNKEKLEKEITENKLQSNVFLLGYRTDIPNLLAISDLYVATSKREGLPVNIIEAMVAGLPVVATNSRGQRELVSDGENGYLVEIGDVISLAEKIENIYLDNRIRDRITEGARAYVEPYLIENVMEEMKEIYNQ
ncbi:MAG: glycosyltransferase family 4 protein [Clostridia bacterium]|nr:glycosyltransferase family 4 protein [Clostridia bacterium]